MCLHKNSSAPFPVLQLAVLLVGALAVRMVFWTGPTGSDDVTYFFFAEKFAALRPFSELHHSVRLVFLLVVGMPAALTGNMAAGIFTNVLIASINDALVAWVAWRLYGRSASILAMFLAAFCGVSIIFPTTFLPDTLLTTFFLIVFIAVWRATTESVPRIGMLLAAGALTGAAYSVKDTGILLIPPAVLYLMLTYRVDMRVASKATFAYLVGVAIFFTLENSVYWLYTGHFFYRQMALQQAHNVSVAPSTVLAFIEQTVAIVRTLATRHVVFGLALVLLAIPCWFAMLRRRPVERLAALIGLFTFAYLVAGTSSLRDLVHLPYQPRYLQPVIPFAVLGVVMTISKVSCRTPRFARALAFGVAMVVVLPSLLAAPLLAGNLYNEPFYRAAARVSQVLASSSRAVFVHPHDLEAMRHFLSPEQLGRLSPLPSDTWPSGYYLVNPSKRPWERIAAESGASLRYDISMDTRTYRNVCPGCSLPDLGNEKRGRVVVLERSP